MIAIEWLCGNSLWASQRGNPIVRPLNLFLLHTQLVPSTNKAGKLVAGV